MKIGSPHSLRGASQLAQTSRAISRALERLSTGRRINGPSDGVADYQTSLRMDSQIRGLSQASLQLNSTYGLLQTANTGIDLQLDIVRRMREIAVEGASSTLSANERSDLQSRLQSLLDEFQRVTDTTTFEKIHLLDGSFEKRFIQAGANAGDGFEIDLPSEKYSDLFSGSTTYEVDVAAGNDGTFSQTATFEEGFSPGLRDLISGDFNGDGNEDVIYRIQGRYVRLLEGNGDGTFDLGDDLYDTGIGNLRDMAVGDFNNDDVLDVIGANYNGNDVSILLGNGDGTFQAEVNVGPFVRAYDVEVADINGDGNDDFLVTNGGGNDDLFIRLGNGDGTFDVGQTRNVGLNPYNLTIGDVTGDGELDLLIGRGTDFEVGLYSGNGDGTFGSGTNVTSEGISLDYVEVADFDGDGDVDMIARDDANEYNFFTYLNNGDGTFASASSFANVGGDGKLAIQDLNSDGVVDLLVTGDTGDYVTLYLGNGDGSFEVSTTYEASEDSSGQTAPVVADFDGDGIFDFVTIDKDNDDIRTYLGGGSPSATTEEEDLDYVPASISVETSTRATELISILDSITNDLLIDHGEVAAQIQRVDFARTQALLMVDEKSRIRDQIVSADFALETAELVRNQILQQAQVAVQAQANVQMRLVLNLLN